VVIDFRPETTCRDTLKSMLLPLAKDFTFLICNYVFHLDNINIVIK
jgi:hypothetical protein